MCVCVYVFLFSKVSRTPQYPCKLPCTSHPPIPHRHLPHSNSPLQPKLRQLPTRPEIAPIVIPLYATEFLPQLSSRPPGNRRPTPSSKLLHSKRHHDLRIVTPVKTPRPSQLVTMHNKKSKSQRAMEGHLCFDLFCFDVFNC